MEYQKIANLIDDTSNQPSKFRTKTWVEINDESRGAYNVNSQIKFKTTIQEFHVIQCYLNHLQLSNVSTDTTVILKEKMLNEKST